MIYGLVAHKEESASYFMGDCEAHYDADFKILFSPNKEDIIKLWAEALLHDLLREPKGSRGEKYDVDYDVYLMIDGVPSPQAKDGIGWEVWRMYEEQSYENNTYDNGSPEEKRWLAIEAELKAEAMKIAQAMAEAKIKAIEEKKQEKEKLEKERYEARQKAEYERLKQKFEKGEYSK